MLSYIIRRILYALPILFTINLFTFFLFFCVNSPDHIARAVLGDKNIKAESLYSWKKEHYYHLPFFLNTKDTLYYLHAEKNTEKPKLPQGFSSKTIQLTPQDFEIHIPNADAPNITLTQIDVLKNSISADTIFVINPQGFTPENMNRLKSEFLIYGYPYILLQTSEENYASYSNSVIPLLNEEQLNLYCHNIQAKGFEYITQTLFFQKACKLFWFDFGKSDKDGTEIGNEIKSRIGPSLMITVPAFFLGLLLNIAVAMMTAYCRGSFLDRGTLFLCIIMMSFVSIFYIIFAQFVLGFKWKLLPSSGYQEGLDSIRFIILPVLISLIAGFGGEVRFYRTLFLEEINKDFVRTARSKGLSEYTVLFKHTLKSAMIPILTGVVVAIPSLYTGSLLLENFFGIPGMGSYTIEGIEGQDFRVVGSMVYLGTFIYIISLILTDIAYTLVDPRVKLR